MPGRTALHELRSSDTGEPVVILLVDDEELSVRAVERALGRIGLVNPLRTAHDGIEGLEELQHGEPPRPRLAIVDLHMPKMGGIEFLERVREADGLRELIVYVLTSSRAPEDIEAVRRLGVIDTIEKGIGLADRLQTALIGTKYDAIEVAPL